jgi:hypothetical protein
VARKKSDKAGTSSRQGPLQPCPLGLSDCP